MEKDPSLRQKPRITAFFLLVILTSATALSINPRSANADLVSDWRETKLNYDQLLRFFSNQRCRLSAANYVACRFALESIEKKVSGAASKPPALNKTQLLARKAELLLEKKEFETQFETPTGQNFDFEFEFSKLRELFTSFVGLNDTEALEAANAINAFYLYAEDPHTSLIPASTFANNHSSEPKIYGGIGVSFEVTQDAALITKVAAESPAQASGVEKGDLILMVDSKITSGRSSTEIASWVRGEVDTEVTLTLARADQILKKTVIRKTIAAAASSSHLLKLETKSRNAFLGVLAVTSFEQNGICEQVTQSLATLLSETQVSGLILDLRDNNGGQIDEMRCIANLFLSASESPQIATNRLTKLNAGWFGVMMPLQNPLYEPVRIYLEKKTDLPLIVLVNSATASAAEMLSGILQDLKRAYIVGRTTFGKGTFHAPVAFELNPAVYLNESFGKYLLPSGRSTQLVGVTPDFELDFSFEESVEEIREKDLFITALPHEGDLWKQNRAEEVESLKRCMDQKTSANSAETSLPQDRFLGTALDVLMCELPPEGLVGR